MKRIVFNLIVCSLTAGIILSCNSLNTDLDTTEAILDSLRSHLAPDSRIELFSVEATASGKQVVLKGFTTRPEIVDSLVSELNDNRILFRDSILRLPDSRLGEKTWGLVTLSVANMRYKPTHSAEMSTQALMGTPLQILMEQNGWYLVRTPDQYLSFTESAGVTLLTEKQHQEWKGTDRVIYKACEGTILTQTGKDSDPVSDIVMGDILAVVEDKAIQGYTQVVLPDGRNGFLPSADVEKLSDWMKSDISYPEKLVSLARSFMGRPYLWGGTSPKGFDCSGFTKTVYFMNGLILQRDASQQVHEGIEVDTSGHWQHLHPGDLLFFGRKATPVKAERATHVGLYAGTFVFIHCSGLVKINSLDPSDPDFKPYYTDNLLHVRRMVIPGQPPVRVQDHPWYN